MESDWEHGQMEEEILLRMRCACNGARFGIAMLLFEEVQQRHRPCLVLEGTGCQADGPRVFWLQEHPLVGICRPSNPLPAETLKAAGYMGGSIYIRGHSAGSYAGMVWETILAEFPNIEGRTVLTATAFPPALPTRSALSYNRQVHLIHHADDRLCVGTRPGMT